MTHMIDQDDIVFLAAACVLVAAKMEDPGVRIRFIVHVFMRLGQRRLGLPVHEFLKPSPERYDDFKTCVTEAEEVLLHQLGFHTAVECPHKYVLIYLAILVDGRVRPESPSSTAAAPVTPTTATIAAEIGQVGDASSCDTGNSHTIGSGVVLSPHTARLAAVVHPLSSRTVYSPEYIHWLGRAVCWINDAARCAALIQLPASVLAVYALHWACPDRALRDSLPSNWVTLFGVSEADFEEMHRVYTRYIQSCRCTSSVQLTQLRSVAPRVPYRRRAEWLRARACARVAAELPPPLSPQPDTTAAERKIIVPSSLTLSEGDAASSHEPRPSSSERGLCADKEGAKDTTTEAARATTVVGGDDEEDVEAKQNRERAARVQRARDDLHMGSVAMHHPLTLPAVEEMEFEDLHEMQRRRRLEEAAEAERRRRERKAGRREEQSAGGKAQTADSRREEGDQSSSHRHHHHRSSHAAESSEVAAAHGHPSQPVSSSSMGLGGGGGGRSTAKEDEQRARGGAYHVHSSSSSNRRPDGNEEKSRHRSQRRHRSSSRTSSVSRRSRNDVSKDSSDYDSEDDRRGRHRRHRSDRYDAYSRHSRRQSSRERHGSSRHGTSSGRRYDIHRPRREEVRRR